MGVKRGIWAGVAVIALAAGGLTFARVGAVGADRTQHLAKAAAGVRDCPTPVPPPADRVASIGAGWAGAWTTAEQPLPGPDLSGRTLRQLVHPTLAGDAVRIRLANTFGATPVHFGGLRVGRTAGPASAAWRGRPVRVTFHGRAGVTLQPGQRATSDVVTLAVRRGDTLAVDTYVPGPGPVHGSTGHARAVQLSYLANGDELGARASAFTERITAWYWLDAVDVRAGRDAGSVVAIGDSLTDGTYSTMSENHRWPDRLAARLQARGSGLGVLNVGIGGNRVTKSNPNCVTPSSSAVSRFDRDVLGQSGVRAVVVAEGINDLATGTPAPAVIAGLQHLAATAHDRGLPVVGATITPFGCPGRCLTPPEQQARLEVNRWIRTSGTFDAVADFEAAVRDPAHPDRIRPDYDLGDHLHLNDAGYRALGDAVPLGQLLRSRTT